MTSVIEVAGSAQAVLARAAELIGQGWTVRVNGSRLTSTGELVWSLSVARFGT